MAQSPSPSQRFSAARIWLFLVRFARLVCWLIAAGAFGFTWGIPFRSDWEIDVLDDVFVGLAITLTVLPALEWPIRRRTPQSNELSLQPWIVGITLGGAAFLYLARQCDWLSLGDPAEWHSAIQGWWRLTVLVWFCQGLLSLYRRVSLLGWNPATTLILSFVVVILLGAMLLMSPYSRVGGRRADFSTALFTSTSAVCVTGLAVVDTGTYWSRTGQTVLLALIQVGGLGIMTYGAFFSLIAGRGLLVRETALLSELLEQKMLHAVRRLVLSILATTLVCEAIGAVLLSTLWPDLPLAERAYFGLFHSISAFCNAGFGLLPDNFERYTSCWQVWGVLGGLIIVGGLGFVVLDNVFHVTVGKLSRTLHRRSGRKGPPPVRLQLTSQLVLRTTAVLLIGGAILFLLLEQRGLLPSRRWDERLAAAWFQSVTCRTAGFNSVPIGPLCEATKFLMIVLMFIGASPGSTGGGVKTTSTAVTVLTLRAVLRGRRQVETLHRTIPETVVYRALLVMSLATSLVVVLTTLLVVAEDRPGKFLDYLFEVVSATGTVGLSTGVTGQLSATGRAIIIVAMFLGRVGPLTLLISLASHTDTSRYRYPDENVMLG